MTDSTRRDLKSLSLGGWACLVAASTVLTLTFMAVRGWQASAGFSEQAQAHGEVARALTSGIQRQESGLEDSLIEVRNSLSQVNQLDSNLADDIRSALQKQTSVADLAGLVFSSSERAKMLQDAASSHNSTAVGYALAAIAAGFGSLLILGLANFSPWRRSRAEINAELGRSLATIADQADEIESLHGQLTEIETERLSDQIDLADLKLIQTVTTQRYQSLFSNLPLACFTVNEYSHVVEWNSQAEALFGFKAHEVVDRSLWDTILVDDPEGIARQKVSEAFLGEIREPFDWPIRRTDGIQRLTTWSMAAVRNAQGQVVGLMCSFQDRTDELSAKAELEATAKFNREITTLCPDLVYIMNLSTRSNVLVNDRIQSVLGYSRSEIEAFGSRLLQELVHPDDVAEVIANHDSIMGLKDGEVCVYEYRMRSKDGQWVWLESHEVVFERDEAGVALTKLGYGRDVTQQKQFNAEISASENRFRTVLESMHDGFVLQQLDGGVTMTNQRAAAILGCSVDKLMSSSDNSFLSQGWDIAGRIIATDDLPFERAKRTGESVLQFTMRLETMDRGDIWLELNSSPLFRQGETRPYAILTVFSDITDRLAYEQHLLEHVQLLRTAQEELEVRSNDLELANLRWEQLAKTDGLTGLANHRALQEALTTGLEQARTTKTPHSVILMDVDRFKLFNDRFGHVAGDEVLRTVGHILLRHAPARAFVGRYGGEEFMVALPGYSAEAAKEIAEILRVAIERYPWPVSQVTASFGVATAETDSIAKDLYVAAADRALYAAKDLGRNRTVHANETNDPLAA